MSDQVLELKTKGNTAFANKDFDIAVDFFTQAIELDPTNHVLYSNRSAAYAQLSKFEDALKDADKCIELNKTFVKGYTRRGAALYGLKKYDDARAAYNAGLEIDPTNAACLEGLESLPNEFDMHNPAQAERAMMDMFKNAVETVKTHPTLKQYADDPEFMKKVEELQTNPASFATSLGDPRMQQLISVLFKLPENTFSQAAQAASQYQAPPPPTTTSTPSTSSSSSSSSSFSSTPAEPPKPAVDPNSPAVKAKALKDEGNKLYKKKQFEQALVMYDRAHAVDPQEPTFLLNTAAAYMELGNRAQQEGEALKAEAEAGTPVSATTVPLKDARLVVRALLRAERVERAEQRKKEKELMAKQKAAEAAAPKPAKEADSDEIAADESEDDAAPAEEQAASSTAETAAVEAEAEPEEEIGEEVPVEDETQLKTLTSEALIARKKEEQAGHYASAFTACEQALAITRTLSGANTYQTLGKIYLRMCNIEIKRENLDQAMEYLRQSLLNHRTDEAVKKEKELKQLIEKKKELDYLDPEKGEEARKAGNDEFVKGNFPEAIKLYTESIRRNPKDARVFSNRAACYQKLMQWSSALDDCDKAIALDPNFIKPYIRKGQVQTFLKQYNQAMRTYEAAMKIDPMNQDVMAGYRELMSRIQQSQQGDAADEQQIQEAMKDPEIRAIMQDPVIQNVLQDISTNPARAQQHLQNDKIASAIAKLMAAGIIKTR